VTLLDAIGLALATIHFGIPLAYYWYLKKRWLPKPWNLNRDPSYTPKVTIIIPTYRESEYIEKKLDNLYQQDYPRDKVEVIVVDSASDDGTPELVKKWAKNHPEFKLTLLEEPIRRGMVLALNYALKHVSKDSEIVVFTDADSFWEPSTLKHVVKYFADPSVGAVTTCIALLEEDNYLETTYRNYYNVIRVGESKIHSTPILNGTLVAFRRELLEEIGGLPTYTGNNDSTPASLIAFMGYRAIQIDDTVVKEPIRRGQAMRKIRRAQHLILHFIYTKRYAKKLGLYRKTIFGKIWKIEAYLHLINPWLLPVMVLLLAISATMESIVAFSLLMLGVLLMFVKPYRTWVLTQLYLIIATIRNIWTKEVAWRK